MSSALIVRQHDLHQIQLVLNGRTKVHQLALDDSAAAHHRLEKQFNIWQSLRSPHFPELEGWENRAGHKAIALNPGKGKSLTEAMAGAASAEKRLALAIGVAEALGAFHAAGYWHGRLHPGSFWWNEEHQIVQLLDLGLATQLSQAPATLITSELPLDQILYVAPEQTGRINRKVDYRADLYTLGAMLYHLIGGEPPFMPEDAVQLAHAHIAQNPRPLHQDHKAPEILSNMVAKLMSKEPEHRYQSVAGLLADLRRLEGIPGVEHLAFELATADRTDTLNQPTRLYGREAELDSLLQRFEQVGQDGVQFQLVVGQAGSGKTSLVHELKPAAIARRAFFIEGKADQLGKSQPYLPWSQALTSLVDQMLAERSQEVRLLRSQIAENLGGNARALLELIPNLEDLLGPQPEVPKLDPAQAQHRFQYLLLKFIEAVTSHDRPIVLFLDDLQWADNATLTLLQALLTSTETGGVFCLVAYRDHEVSPQHPLRLMLDEVAKLRNVPPPFLAGPLSSTDTTEFIADALRCSEDMAAPLAATVHQKTHGNALFIRAFLDSLEKEGYLTYDHAKGQWQYDINAIRGMEVTSNVVDLLAAGSESLSEACRTLLQTAACLGNKFDMALLKELLGFDNEAFYDALDEAQLKAYVERRSSTALKFSHDRIQQMFYEQLDEESTRHTHLTIGRKRWQNADSPEVEAELFSIVNHWNAGLSLLTSREEFNIALDLNLKAASKAKASNAYEAAAEYLEHASRLSENIGLNDKDPRAFQLQKETAEIAFLKSDFEQAEKLLRSALKQTDDSGRQTELQSTLIVLLTMDARYGEAIELGRKILQERDLALPSGELDEPIGAEIGAVFQLLGERQVKDLIELDAMSSEEDIQTAVILASMLAPSFFSDQKLFALLVSKVVRLSLEHGNLPFSCFGYGCFGIILTSVGNYQAGCDFGEMALALAKKMENPTEIGRACFHLGQFTAPRVRPLSTLRQLNREGYLAALESGDLQYAGYLSIYDALYPSFQEQPLGDTLQALEASAGFNARTHNTISLHAVQAFQLAYHCLAGLSDGPRVFALPQLTEVEFLETCGKHQNVLAICFYGIFKSQTHYLHRDYDLALAALSEAEPYLQFIGGLFFTENYRLFKALTQLALWQTKGKVDKDTKQALDSDIQHFETLAGVGSDNWSWSHSLLLAEKSLAEGEYLEAIARYNLAITEAQNGGFEPMVGLAHERLAQCWQELDNTLYVGFHLREAYRRFEQWGAKHVSQRLARQLEDLGFDHFVQASPAQRKRQAALRQMDHIDLETVIRASQALSGEIVLSELLDRMLHIVMENAGAETGAILMRTAKGWESNAVDHAAKTQRAAGGEKLPFAQSIVDYVSRTGRTLLLHHAATDQRFMSDAKIAEQQVKSLLCIPIHVGEELKAMVYLENNLISGAFTQERLALLEMLSGQMAISLENATLYAEMEEKVEERTRDLENEKNQTEALLLNILPAETAAELKATGSAKAQRFEAVTVMFADIQGFTEIASRLSPEKLVAEIDHCFKAFDRILETTRVEKIKTVGDGYICAGGLPTPYDESAREVLVVALQMQAFMATYKQERQQQGRPFFEIRIGIHTGPVVAGIVGLKKFAYDIWGDTVNIAARLEASCDVGYINVSQSTRDAAVGAAMPPPEAWSFKERGDIEVKGKGAMAMYYLQA